MKNKIFIFSLFLISLFCYNNVNASTKVGINIDAHEHFNYYYEQRQNTGFYNWLKNTDFRDYFGSSSTDNFGMMILYASDYPSSAIGTNCFNSSDLIIPSNAKYIVAYRSHPSASINPISVSVSGNDYSVTSSLGPYTIEFFDEDGYSISRRTSSCFVFNYSKNYHFSNYKDEDSADFTYLISSFYSSSLNGNYLGDRKIIVTDIIEDGEHYLIDDNDNYSGWLRKFFSFGGLDYASVVDTDLNYFKSNVIKNYFPSLKQILDAGVQLEIPENYVLKVLDTDNENYIFIPKDINNNDLNRKFLLSTNETIGFSNFKVGVNTYSLNDNYTSPYEENSLKFIKFSQPNKLYVLDINKELRSINENYSLTNYLTAFGLFGNAVKYSANIYYNSNAYTVCNFSVDGNNSCTFTNPLTNEEQTLTHEQMYTILSQHNYSGASSNIFDSPEEQCKTATDHSELYEYDDDCNIIGVKDTTGSGGLLEGLENINKFVNSFKAIFVTIFSYFNLLFTTLPYEIRSVLLFSLIAGTVLTLYKIIRG